MEGLTVSRTNLAEYELRSASCALAVSGKSNDMAASNRLPAAILAVDFPDHELPLFFFISYQMVMRVIHI